MSNLPFSIYLRFKLAYGTTIEFIVRDLPAWRLWAKVHLDADDHWGNTGGGKHPSPGRCWSSYNCDVLKCDRDNEPQHDSESGPHLPHHGKGSADGLWCRFGGIDGRGRGFCTDSKSEHETCDKKIGPYRESELSVHASFDEALLTAVSGCHPDTGDERNDAGDEDGSTTAEVLVQRRVGPAPDETRAEVRSTVKQTLKPDLVLSDAEFLKVELLDKPLVAGHDGRETA